MPVKALPMRTPCRRRSVDLVEQAIAADREFVRGENHNLGPADQVLRRNESDDTAVGPAASGRSILWGPIRAQTIPSHARAIDRRDNDDGLGQREIVGDGQVDLR